jgi:hypothetical protein
MTPVRGLAYLLSHQCIIWSGRILKSRSTSPSRRYRAPSASALPIDRFCSPSRPLLLSQSTASALPIDRFCSPNRSLLLSQSIASALPIDRRMRKRPNHHCARMSRNLHGPRRLPHRGVNRCRREPCARASLR